MSPILQSSQDQKKQPSRLDLVMDYIRDGIVSGQFKSGERIPNEAEIGDAVGVSRTPVREAIKVLTAIGVLDVQHGLGTFVTPGVESSLAQLILFQIYLKGTSAEKLVEVRMVFERSCAELAASRRTPEDLKEMRRCIDRLKDLSMRKDRDLEEVTTADLDFHKAVYRASGNELLESISSFVLNMLAESVKTAQKVSNLERVINLHELMFTMIEKGVVEGVGGSFGVDANMQHFQARLETGPEKVK